MRALVSSSNKINVFDGTKRSQTSSIERSDSRISLQSRHLVSCKRAFSEPNEISMIKGEENCIDSSKDIGKKDFDDQIDGDEILPFLNSDHIRSVSVYFKFSSVLSNAIKNYFEDYGLGKLGSSNGFDSDHRSLYFAYLFCTRNILLTFIDNREVRTWLGEVESIRPHRQMLMVSTIWSIYLVAVLRNFRPNSHRNLSWLEPFRVLRGESMPKSFGLNKQMLLSWYCYTLLLWRFYLGVGVVVFLTFSFQNIFITYDHHWYDDDDNDALPHSNNLKANVLRILWTIIQTFWLLLLCAHIYISSAYFNCLCYYFRIRYEKVNQDIGSLIDRRLKANDRIALIQNILVEHNSLCLKVFEYNKFWASYLMSTYFLLVSVICFSTFQAFFTDNIVSVRIFMSLVAMIAGLIITRISMSAAVMSNKAHEPYGKLIRITFEKYPVELQIQLRMFIQRTSGPTIGFYCLDVFEITYTTYASILAALGQNFLLIVDFVRSCNESLVNNAVVNAINSSIDYEILD
ncbi:BLTX81 protein [Sarcoptes scabiei]|nr:BLTX81 protein [Sarcoptes scabiei]